MACNEFGPGRLAEPPVILAAIEAFFGPKPLAGRHALVTSGPTHEPIDPVRYIANRSSGRQGTAIAAALLRLGRAGDAGQRPDGAGLAGRRGGAPGGDGGGDAGGVPGGAAGGRGRVCRGGRRLACRAGGGEAQEAARRRPAHAASAAQPGHPGHPVCCPARAGPPGGGVRGRDAGHGGQRRGQAAPQGLRLDRGQRRAPATGIMAGESNQVQLVTAEGAEDWPMLPKTEVATRLADRIAAALA